MSVMDLIKENIEYEQLLSENFSDTVVKGEYLIPDTHPDAYKILMVDVKPEITSKETMQDKVYIEGQIQYNVIYLAKEDDGYGVYNVVYNDKFSNYVDIPGAEFKMSCQCESYIEHMDSNIINERKVSINGVIKLKSSVYKDYNFQVIKSLEEYDDIQTLKYPAVIDKVSDAINGEVVIKSELRIPGDKPQIGNVLKCDLNIHKKDAKIMQGKIYVSAYASIRFLYRAAEGKELVCLEDDVFINRELDMNEEHMDMYLFPELTIGLIDYDIKEDENGEKRSVDIEAIGQVSVKPMYKENIDMIDDVYSPRTMMEMVKKNYPLNIMQGAGAEESIVKENLELTGKDKPVSIVIATGNVSIADKKIVEDKVVVDGIVNVDILYRTDNEEISFDRVTDELPFTSSIQVEGAKIDMQCIAKSNLESIEASVEGNTIAVKAVVSVNAKVNYVLEKEFLVDIMESDEPIPEKKSSVTIYVVQRDDSLWKIAKKYFTTVDEIARINDIENENLIYPGDKLIIPGRAVI
ncbi:DUF3794 and LysM peptidoglycan-binding domain-containing protein [Clostridium oryzae]|uniref:SpoIVD-associated factor A n=1 Tax=Clostridium oryzae TaxID=1450648 RepID=A0A1V4IUD5_9CLOT|nr:SPOCS domain-containing protein [Clostridium oryzae]OPJ63395.1 SpoIVD-associated factor A [Clostridium oryzae]